MNSSDRTAELTVIMVNWNTRDLTLRALETLFENAGDVDMHVILWDNGSADGSADAIAERFPQVELVRSPDNLGFGLANNRAVELTDSEWLLLLNPDTETHPHAIANLLRFAKSNPQAGIVGGRTVFPDGSLNIASCFDQMTLWSLFCRATGLAALFKSSRFFNSEAIAGWERDSVREVDIVVGCLLMIRRDLWERLGGFNPRYFMFGEEVDLCLRAQKLGYQPMITPDAQIMHLVGASYSQQTERVIRIYKGRSTLIRDHWSGFRARLGLGMLWLWSAARALGSKLQTLATGRESDAAAKWLAVWRQRGDWLAGY